MRYLLLLAFAVVSVNLFAQKDYWQQRVEYVMDIDFDSENHQFDGNQELVYYNNSPDTLFKVFYHLYFNAFQPGSMMDIRNQQLPDSDDRVKGRIGVLEENEIGYHKIKSLKQDGQDVPFEVVGIGNFDKYLPVIWMSIGRSKKS